MTPRTSVGRKDRRILGLATPATSDSSSLKLLKSELGRDAYLLDHIPISAVRMLPTSQVPNYLPYKIYVGTIEISGRSCDAWAFLSTDLKKEQDGVPQMKIFANPQHGPLASYSSDHIDDDKNGHWTEVFKKINIKFRRIVFIKVSACIAPGFQTC